jgi:large subunit ribosomal protein L25
MATMDRITLEGHPRTKLSKGERNRIRSRGDVPGIVYGKGLQPQPIFITGESFKQLRGKGRTLIDLSISGDGTVTCMVHEVERDMLNKKPMHIDLHAVSLTEPINVEIPIILDGLEPVEKRGGVIQQQTRDVLVRCLPTDVPEFILLNIAKLEIGENLTCGDLPLPNGVVLMSDPAEVVCAVMEAKFAPPDTEIEPKEPELVHDTEGKGEEANV